MRKDIALLQISFAEHCFLLAKEVEEAFELEEEKRLKFHTVLVTVTPLIKELRRQFLKTYRSVEDFIDYINPILIHINRAYRRKSVDWKQEVASIVSAELEKYKNEVCDKRERAGIFFFEPIDKCHDPAVDERVGGRLIEIHFDGLFGPDDPDLTAGNIKMSFCELARKAREFFPGITAVYGKSWLAGHPIVKRVGFKCLGQRVPYCEERFWLQFLDKCGNIHHERSAKFLADMRFPYAESHIIADLNELAVKAGMKGGGK